MVSENMLHFGAVLQDDEVVAWQALEAYFLKHKIVQPYAEGSSTLPARRVIRQLLHLAGKQVPQAISPKLAAALAVPASKESAPSNKDLPRDHKKSKKGKRSDKSGSTGGKKVDSQPKRRVIWNRQSNARPGTAE